MSNIGKRWIFIPMSRVDRKNERTYVKSNISGQTNASGLLMKAEK